jgi:hypothetical protein
MSKILKQQQQQQKLKDLEICQNFLNEFLKNKSDEMRRVYNFKIFINAKILEAQKN